MIKANKHILFITISNLANNPRLYKEACLALDNDISITIIQFSLGNWSDDKTQFLIDQLNARTNTIRVVVKTLNATKRDKAAWLYYGLVERYNRIIASLFKYNIRIAAFAHSKRSAQIINFLKKNKVSYNLICAHNLGALYPAAYLSKKTGVPFAFDVEDYHPEECISEDAVKEKRRRILLMQQLIPKAQFYTSASPLIGQYTEQLVGNMEKHKVILNAFPKDDFQLENNEIKLTETLRFVWFSQNIAHGRGLEQFFNGLKYWLKEKSNVKISITLIGNMYEDFQKYLENQFSTRVLKQQVSVEHIPPLNQTELHNKLLEFDIGIASEQVSTDFNREICLTNKIIAYAQAGTFILATDTKAQVDFLNRYKGIGLINTSEPKGFSVSLDYIWANRKAIIANKLQRLKLTAELNWETESEILLKMWSNFIK